MTFRGTKKGDQEEIEFVKDFNKHKEKYYHYLNTFIDDDKDDNLWMVRVTTKQTSTLSNRKVFTRSDSYLIQSEKINKDFMLGHDYYLDENILNSNDIKHTKFDKSGVSIKMTNSKSYQILKIGPNSFKKLFGSYELGAGASLYCLKENELIKNKDLINGWYSTNQQMAEYFEVFTNNNINFIFNKDVCQKIKTFSCKTISDKINNSDSLKKIIFNGKGIYDEPYSAYYFYQNNSLTKLRSIPFNVTTGSGRSRGDYTVVLKPK